MDLINVLFFGLRIVIFRMLMLILCLKLDLWLFLITKEYLRECFAGSFCLKGCISSVAIMNLSIAHLFMALRRKFWQSIMIKVRMYIGSAWDLWRASLSLYYSWPCIYRSWVRSVSVTQSERSKGKKNRRIIFHPESTPLSLGCFEELSKARRSVLDPPWEGLNLIPGDVLWTDPTMQPGLSPDKERGIRLVVGAR